MADIALIEVMNQAAEIATNPTVKANSTLNWLMANINWIEPKMRSFQSRLKQLESKPAETPGVASLISDIRNLALAISYNLDTYLSETEAHDRNRRSRFVKHAACVSCCGNIANDNPANYYALQRRELEILADDIEQKIRYADFQGGRDVERPARRITAEVDSQFVGREESLEQLKAQLFSTNSECKVISVVGAGGIGKTSLVERIYRDNETEYEFYNRFAVYVPHEPRARDILLEIAKQAGFHRSDTDDDVDIKLYKFLERERWLLYLDDIRRVETWDELRRVLPIISSGNYARRIIITSRYASVGRYIASDERCLVELNPLDPHDSYKLFLGLMNRRSENTIGRLKEIGEVVVQRCHGFPLAIEFAVDTVMEKNRAEHAWEEAVEYVDKSDENYLIKNWHLSYKELPMELRYLFLYFGLYPVDSEISVSELTRALVTDKLVKLEGNQDPEDNVEAQLEKLIDFNLIQVSRRRLNGRIKSCRVNHFQYILCIRVARESNLFAKVNNVNINDLSRIHKLTVNDCTLSRNLCSKFKDARLLRTLLCFARDGETDSVPDEISDLRLLTYLKLTGHYEKIPSSISKLNRLETLDVGKASFNSAFPTTLWKMESIKHLLLSCESYNPSDNAGSNSRSIRKEVNLPNVETLGWITGDILKTSSLKNLRKLKLFDASEDQIEDFSKLEKLKQLWLKTDPQWCMKFNMSGYRILVRLNLSCDWSDDMTLENIQFPPNIIELILKRIKFKDDPMSVLKKLPRLKCLKLKHCFYGLLILNCLGPDNFLELLVLEITDSFSKLIVDDTGMPKLAKFIYGGDAEPDIPDKLRAIMTTISSDKSVDNTGGSRDIGGPRDKTKEPIPWSDENELAFIKILHENARSRKLPGPTFTEDEWDKINKDMLTITKLDYGIDRLKGKWNHLCMVHHMFSQLLGHREITLDPNANHVDTAEKVQQQFCTIYKTEYETFWKEGWKYYELLTSITGETTSTGGLENASTHWQDGGTSNKHQNEDPSISKTELEAGVGIDEPTNQDHYSKMVCLNILNKMEEVSNNAYMKAINAFKDPDFRMSFVMMPNIRRGPILELL